MYSLGIETQSFMVSSKLYEEENMTVQQSQDGIILTFHFF
ncbi:hypothetical protein CP03DC35_0944 [Chlamydia psittaci 03DC35]|nr:hypothetical protein CP02DC18_0959 [Chlamydia psittaci 02DC18]EPJ16648.1 hypothetical protein CP02DC22_0956 [Chlamydia psittaci 02DC22]EPJ23054.1 hypothetical protein CP03DC29_0636 [Chlamydia psittaci 03DC29]EPJ29457.1 hypothetical protein CPC1998_0225 [Chlamydia psittaci C19/98]EPJ30204.1 hypothetical protein CP03DC35_0944 [Chlamydia psittaci 03DC35]EPL00393.1 hypothetical protein CP02DC24_0225 [Chlamydia psittaci 02DC24]EPP33433.1 hypothetical protein CPC698_0837 [Chlamydia psittaci C6/9